MQVTDKLIRQIYPTGGKWLEPCMPFFADAMKLTRIEEDMDQCIFLTQMEHECDHFNTLREYASGAQYEGRVDLGNIYPGDGVRFAGRGGIQNTGRNAYLACGQFFGVDFIKNPELMQTPRWAIHGSAWFWTVFKKAVGLQQAAKRGWLRVTTRIVNGGYNGWDDRLQAYQGNADVFKLPRWTQAGETESIKRFQASVPGLVVDGDAGQRTLTALART